MKINTNGTSNPFQQKTLLIEKNIFESNLTPLMSQVNYNVKSDFCSQLRNEKGSLIITSKTAFDLQYNQGFLEKISANQDLRNEIIKKLKSRVNPNYKLTELCSTPKNIYAVFIKTENIKEEYEVLLWDKNDFKKFEVIPSINGYYYSFIPEIDEQKSIFTNGYADIGRATWNYYFLDHQNLKVKKVEECQGQFKIDPQTKKFSKELTYSCPLMYSPA